MLRPDSRRAGLTLIEVAIAGALLAVMTIALTSSLERQSRSMMVQTSSSAAELKAEMVLDQMVGRLEYARWVDTRTQLSGGIGGGDGSITVEEIDGFPPTGTLILESGLDEAERVTYGDLNPAGRTFDQVLRGDRCTAASGWGGGTAVHWEGLALYTTDQVAPDPDEMEGLSFEMGRPVFYLGDGTGLVYQVPVRVGGDVVFDANGELVYGASLEGADEPTAFQALRFVATDSIVEQALATDLNLDGDEDDLFDLGRIELITWDGADPDRTWSAFLSPAFVVQEVCDWGSDLDGDGFDDPMFLLNPASGRLRIRLFTFSGFAGSPRLHRDELTVFLENHWVDG